MNNTERALAGEEELASSSSVHLFLNDKVWVYLKCRQGKTDYKVNAFLFHQTVLPPLPPMTAG